MHIKDGADRINWESGHGVSENEGESMSISKFFILATWKIRLFLPIVWNEEVQ